MIDPRTIELMNRALDGVATEPERADLDRALTASAEARSHYEAMSRIVCRLSEVEMIAPPSELHQKIVAAVEGVEKMRAVPRAPHAHPAHEQEHGFVAWLRHAFSPPGLRYGATFGLGLAAGAVILWVVAIGQPGDATRGVNPSHVSGTISTPSSGVGSLPVAIPEVGVSGSVAVLDRGSVTQVHLKVDGEEGIEWVFDVPDRDEPTRSVVLRVVKSGETVFQGTVPPVEP
jgi:anti-sigma factor RsiW